MLGLNWSTQERANDEHCACCMAEHMDGRRSPKDMAPATGVLLVMGCGVIEGVGRGPKRAMDGSDGVWGRSGFGSKKRGT